MSERDAIAEAQRILARYIPMNLDWQAEGVVAFRIRDLVKLRDVLNSPQRVRTY